MSLLTIPLRTVDNHAKADEAEAAKPAPFVSPGAGILGGLRTAPSSGSAA
jgi:hypothetical protein